MKTISRSRERWFLVAPADEPWNDTMVRSDNAYHAWEKARRLAPGLPAYLRCVVTER